MGISACHLEAIKKKLSSVFTQLHVEGTVSVWLNLMKLRSALFRAATFNYKQNQNYVFYKMIGYKLLVHVHEQRIKITTLIYKYSSKIRT